MQQKPRVGLKDIAEYMGVSSAAVSLALNDRPGVSKETRRRVNEAVKKLGYQRRRGGARNGRDAGALSALRSIGFYAFGVNADVSHSYYGAILSGASAAARGGGARLAFESFDGPIDDPSMLSIHANDGLLITGRPPREFVLRLHEEGVPYVLVCCSLSHLPGDSIGPENIESSYRVVEHLAGLGHRRIAYLGGEPDNLDAQERYLGYRWAVGDLGLDADEDLAMLSFFDAEHGVSGLGELLGRAGDFTALYAASDFLAMGVYQSARELGLSIPRDLSVVGFDNNALSETLHPQLTTVGLDRERVGRLAVRRLAEVAAEPQPPLIVRVPTAVLDRESCRRLDG